jgi:hypothetical protein
MKKIALLLTFLSIFILTGCVTPQPSHVIVDSLPPIVVTGDNPVRFVNIGDVIINIDNIIFVNTRGFIPNGDFGCEIIFFDWTQYTYKISNEACTILLPYLS